MARYYKKILLITFLVLCVCNCASCNKEEQIINENDIEGYKIYYPDEKGTEIVSDVIDVSEEDTDALINELIIKLKEGNYSKAKKAVIPASVEYATYTLEANILTLIFDDNYLKLKGMNEVLRRAAIVYTFVQLDKVDYVRIQVNGKALVVDGDEIGDMSRGTFRDLVVAKTDDVIDDTVKLYFSDVTGKKLRVLEDKIVSDGTLMKEEVLIQRLLKGPKKSSKYGYYKTINPEAKVNRVAVNNKVCYIDFNEAFLERRDGVSEEVVVYSIVNTLTELSTVNQVRITIDGEVRDVFNEYADISGFIERNYDIMSYEE